MNGLIAVLEYEEHSTANHKQGGGFSVIHVCAHHQHQSIRSSLMGVCVGIMRLHALRILVLTDSSTLADVKLSPEFVAPWQRTNPRPIIDFNTLPFSRRNKRTFRSNLHEAFVRVVLQRGAASPAGDVVNW